MAHLGPLRARHPVRARELCEDFFQDSTGRERGPERLPVRCYPRLAFMRYTGVELRVKHLKKSSVDFDRSVESFLAICTKNSSSYRAHLWTPLTVSLLLVVLLSRFRKTNGGQ